VVSDKNLKDLMLHTLKDVYFAEHEILKALPEMEAAAESQRLREAFSTHRRQTEQQIDRLKRVFQSLGEKAEGAPCEAIQGILAEGREAMEEFAGSPASGAALVAAAQAVEHYEIARYGALRSWAELAELDEAEQLLEQTLDEERTTDALLTEIAEEMVNPESA
jgi:ferritin-like metal-binding protein YciE